ncbi:hypothetical protein GH714_024432 [Hevea brasiliensis]|uniref:Uncharacterized protein n=1 Tax=Hevea brasiliensis TaxID=3981 RepID=A0A6A6LC95_HEVBR|nr:hypothetical protein GH714_024432 [Hevea brasiliensis]
MVCGQISGFRFRRRFLLLWPVILFSLLVILGEVVYLIIWAIKGSKWSGANAWWAHLTGLMVVQSWKSLTVIYLLVVQLLAVFVAFIGIYGNRFGVFPWQDSCWGHFLTVLEQIGSYFRVASCLLLPAIQLGVGISHPSWLSLPFFIGNCAGLVDWSLTSNFLGLFRWWRPLQLYASFSIILLYVYQLPIEVPSLFHWIADFIGLFKISGKTEWPEICSGLSLVLFYLMLSFIKSDLEEMDFIMSMRESNLAEQLLPIRHSFFIRQSSVCAFGLLAYVGYIVYAFPSVFRMHRLNGLLLVFILFWAVSTYIFNVAFPLFNRKLEKDMEIWEMVGLWHYPIPGFFLLAQFCLGILVALGNLVNNSVFLYLSDEGNRPSIENSTVEVEEGTKVLIVATIAWGLRKCSRAIMLALIFLIAMKPGFIHAVYTIVQHTPSPPVGFSILKAGLNKSVLLSVYASQTAKYSHDSHSYESRIASFLSAVGQKFLSMYRSCGTYIAFLTILFTVYLVTPNYISFGFALLNAISMLYIALLAACILVKQRIIRLIVDDSRMLASYFVVFMLACFKLHSDRFSSFSGSSTYRQMMSQRKNTFVWKDLSFETKSMWTFLDYLRLYCYCHLLDLVLCLILITGTLEYDILHLGYLAFALVFFRMRLVMLKKKTRCSDSCVYTTLLLLFCLLLINLLLWWYLKVLGSETLDYIYEMIGFYKYDYGFRITARSALVEIIIFVLGGLRRRTTSLTSKRDSASPEKVEQTLRKQEPIIRDDSSFPFEVHESLESADSLLFDSGKKERAQSKENPLKSAVQLIGDGVSQVQSIGNQAVNNLSSITAKDGEWMPLVDEWYKSLTPAADVAKEILKAKYDGLVEAIGFPYLIISVIGGGKREIDLYAYIFGADLSVFFLVAIFYQSVIKNKSEFLDVYQLEDQFPKEFVFVLMVIFFLIVLDRIIYLCSFATGKGIDFIELCHSFMNCDVCWTGRVTTSLTMYDWLKLEDIHASLYLVKCDTVLNRAQHKQGEKQTKWTKCCNGICLFFILICVIWAPMLIYSSGNPTNIANPIKDASVQLDIKTAGGRLTLYQTTLCEKLQWDNVNSDVDLDPNGYLNLYNKNDIQLICCQADASMLWLVPDVVQKRFIQSLDGDLDLDILFIWVLNRERPKGKEVVKYEKPVDSLDLPTRSDVQKVLNGSTNSFRIYNLYPRYLRVTGSGDVRPLEQEVSAVSADLIINRADFSWWSFHGINSSDLSGCGGLTGPTAIIMSEETPPQGILGDTISKFSIWGLYITFVLAVGRFIRLQCSDLRMRIPYENLPSCDRLIAICEDIYAARAEGELGVEEVLYWTLVKIYRSPHMLLEYTKPD